jgi:hypothetical protein
VATPRSRPARRLAFAGVDPVAELERSAPEQVEIKRLAGQVVWLREGAREWLGPAEEALERLRGRDAGTSFWACFDR